MLVQQGLEEIAQAPTSEQIAFLLVERARLLDELEAEQSRSVSVADGRASEDLQRTLEKEREELQEAFESQRENTRTELDQLRREHEEEINVVMDENQRLEEELAASKDKVRYLANLQLNQMRAVHIFYDISFNLNRILCCDHSLESSRRDDSNEWLQHRSRLRNKKMAFNS